MFFNLKIWANFLLCYYLYHLISEVFLAVPKYFWGHAQAHTECTHREHEMHHSPILCGAQRGEKGAEKNYFTTETQRARSLRKRNWGNGYLNFFSVTQCPLCLCGEKILLCALLIPPRSPLPSAAFTTRRSVEIRGVFPEPRRNPKSRSPTESRTPFVGLPRQ